jgi:hypothetical protein
MTSAQSGYNFDYQSAKRIADAVRRIEGLPQGPSTKLAKPPIVAGTSLLVADFPSLVTGVVSATARSAGSASFTLAGNFAATFVAGFPFQVVGSVSNNGFFRTAAAGATFSGGNTVVPVNEAIAADTSTGWVALWDIPPMAVVGAVAGASGSFSVGGNYAALFLAGWPIDVVRSANNSATYVLSAAPTYNASSNQTTFTVSGTVSSGVADGYVVPHYPAPHEASTVFPACQPSTVTLPAGGFADWAPGNIPAQFCSMDQYVPRGSLVVLTAGITSNVIPRQSFIFTGGGGTTQTFSRLDPNSGTAIWTQTRGGGVCSLCCDANGCVYTGGPPASGTGYTHEKWDSSGNLIWGAAASGSDISGVSGIAIDSTGNVYTAVNYTGSPPASPQIQKWSPTGSQVTSGDFPITGDSDKYPLNCIAVDRVDGRIAVGWGNLAPSAIDGGFDVELFGSLGNPISLVTGGTSGQVAAIESITFDLAGNLYAVGLGGTATINLAIGFILNRSATFLSTIQFGVGLTAFHGYGVASDGLGRILVASMISRDNSANSVLLDYTTGAFSLTGSKLIAEFYQSLGWTNQAVAADAAGNFYVVVLEQQVSQAQIHAFDALGRLRWKNAYWPSGSFQFDTPLNYQPLLAAS